MYTHAYYQNILAFIEKTYDYAITALIVSDERVENAIGSAFSRLKGSKDTQKKKVVAFDLFFENHLKNKEIAEKLNTSSSFVSAAIRETTFKILHHIFYRCENYDRSKLKYPFNAAADSGKLNKQTRHNLLNTIEIVIRHCDSEDVSFFFKHYKDGVSYAKIAAEKNTSVYIVKKKIKNVLEWL